MHTLAFLDAVRDPAGTFLHLLVSALAHFVDGARSEIERALTRYLFTTVDTSTPSQPAAGPPIAEGRQVASLRRRASSARYVGVLPM